MLQRLKQRIADMRTIKTLSEGAERHANAMGEREPGPEHFLLAALDLPDGLAQRAFVRAGADPARLRAGIAAAHGAALAAAGADPALLAGEAPVPPGTGAYRAKGSMETVMRSLADWPRAAGEPLTGAHVAAVVASSTQGTAARALKAIGIDAAMLAAAARAELDEAARRVA
ncbi:Clp protease N-terminal domain-containing protein [Pseudoduganella sp. SL102]|uniref:Clp protease N-terminal domain-containing protein n=1 Tax=Pseudoduganella sp. SL102 TaxID=2995154 RepID=UPI00248B6E57|nr:Clp protease N-terminal domain-containing protein [Pseudoduganella sp. SL102]WBS02640.1 Clp protease N-terminal domain-containing protein [Pseudoduganella sp. SL102]